jgi:hypothetical protein
MNTLTKTTHIAKVRTANKEGIQQVCYLLDCSEQFYCDYLFSQYCLFIENKYKGYPDLLANQILYSKYFRGFFNNEAAKRDEVEFLPYAIDVTEELMMINTDGRLQIIEPVPVGGDYLINEWLEIHSYQRLLDDEVFLNHFEHILKLIKIL